MICNDRVVLAADKTADTVWGVDSFQTWHPQYNGFAGFVFFSSLDPKRLPWGTTKREVDTADPLYRRALGRMKEPTASFIAYTHARKADIDTAKLLESQTSPVNIMELTTERSMRLPELAPRAKKEFVTISYRRALKEIEEVKHVGISLPDAEITKYRDCYRHFPVFAETLI